MCKLSEIEAFRYVENLYRRHGRQTLTVLGKKHNAWGAFCMVMLGVRRLTFKCHHSWLCSFLIIDDGSRSKNKCSLIMLSCSFRILFSSAETISRRVSSNHIISSCVTSPARYLNKAISRPVTLFPLAFKSGTSSGRSFGSLWIIADNLGNSFVSTSSVW